MLNEKEAFELYTAMTRREVLNAQKIDCDYCRNAYTCEGLSHDDDLSYKGCGVVADSNIRLMFRTGDGRTTKLLVETYTPHGWVIVADLVPKYCPFCGRMLVENNEQRINKEK